MKNKQGKNSNIIEEMLKTIEVVGIDETSKILQKARYNSLTLNDSKIEFILKTISDETDVSVDRIIHGTDKTDERKAAVGLCVYFIRRDLKYSYALIKKILKKDEAALSRYNTMIASVNMDNPRCILDEIISKNYKKLNLIFLQNKIK